VRAPLGCLVFAALLACGSGARAAETARRLAIAWTNNFLTIRGEHIPGKEIRINYLEAYCRPGSTDRDWGETVIGHRTELVSADAEQGNIRLKDALGDGVVVKHTITAANDEVDFRLTAKNPMAVASDAHWAQPCIRVDGFTGCDPKDARLAYPPYIRQCFIFVEGRATRLPTEPWATKARYTPGQVYCPANVDRNDVNPRPLSRVVPSNGLLGCYSADGKRIFAVAWEPYQELFQGVATCIHSDFRLGGLKPGETKHVRGKIYIVPSDMAGLVKRYERDFPQHVAKPRK